MSSDSVEWYTPPEIILECGQMIFGDTEGFDLDVCATLESAVAARYFTKETDAFAQPQWDGARVWMNPPYGRGIDEWVDRLVREYLCGNAETITALVPARTDTKWFQENLCGFKSAIFKKGRIEFWGTDVEEGAPFPSVILTSEIVDSARVPSNWGFCVRL